MTLMTRCPGVGWMGVKEQSGVARSRKRGGAGVYFLKLSIPKC